MFKKFRKHVNEKQDLVELKGLGKQCTFKEMGNLSSYISVHRHKLFLLGFVQIYMYINKEN